jgi:hypothetical protein
MVKIFVIIQQGVQGDAVPLPECEESCLGGR